MSKNSKKSRKSPQSLSAQTSQSQTESARMIRERNEQSNNIKYIVSGLVLSMLVVLFMAYTLYNNAKHASNSNVAKKILSNNTTVISPLPSDNPEVKITPTMVIQPTKSSTRQDNSSSAAVMNNHASATILDNTKNQDSTPTEAAPLVKKLPFTQSASFIYSVRANDSLAKIGITFCNDSRAYLTLANDNNISAPFILQVGQQIIVDCK